VPTFDDGWICRECWCANREHDGRCYRCHAERPDYIVPDLAKATPAPASKIELPVIAAAAAPADEVASLKPAPVEAVHRHRFCLSCGRQLLQGAAFCTQCGTPASERGPAGEREPASVVAQAAPPIPKEPEVAPRTTAPKQPRTRAPRPALNLPRPAPGAWLQAMRDRYLAFVEREAFRWELSMAGLAVVFVAIAFVAERVDGSIQEALQTVGWLITALFVAEFSSRLAAAHDPRNYLRGHWIDLVALLPPLRVARVLSLLRFLPMVPGTARAWATVREVVHTLRTRAQLSLFIAWLGLMLGCTLLLARYADSATGGSGRLIGGALLVVGLALFSAVTAALTTFLLAPRRNTAAEQSEQSRAMGEMRDAGVAGTAEYGTTRAAGVSSLAPPERIQSRPIAGSISPRSG
jgi:voltage-gated potassium channel